MTDIPTIQARLQALLDAMAGAVGPIMPPNDVKGERVRQWMTALTDVLQGLRQTGAIPISHSEIAVTALQMEATRFKAERDDALLALSHAREAGTALSPEAPHWKPSPLTRTAKAAVKPIANLETDEP